MIIANGGLKTLPESGREILNSDDIAPNLAILNLANGTIDAVVEPDRTYKKLSIRHLARTSDDRIVFACQHQGDADELPPLVGLLNLGARRVCSMRRRRPWRGSTIMSARSRSTQPAR